MPTNLPPMPVLFSDKATMAIEALSYKDREKVLHDTSRFESNEYQDWIRIHSQKLAEGIGGPLWTLKVGTSLRVLYRIDRDITTGQSRVLVLDVAPRERLDKLVRARRVNP